MATVTGLTAARMLQIEAKSIVSGSINPAGNLILEARDGTQIDAGSVKAIIGNATDVSKGLVELATSAETAAGTDATLAVTPAGLAALTGTDTRRGILELATTAEVQAGTDTARAVTPAGLAALTATDTRKGISELATNAEAFSGTDTVRSITPANLASVSSREGEGVYVPPGWGKFWRAKRDAAGSANATIAAVGSSSVQGLNAANLVTSSFMAKIMTSLQATYGNGGSGYFSAGRSLAWLGAAPTTNAWDLLTGNLAKTTGAAGSWLGGNPWGVGGTFLYTQTPGNTISFVVRGTRIKIYTISGAGRVNWNYTIDGGAPVNVNDSGTAGSTIQTTTINGLTNANHTVVMTHAGASGSSLSVCGVSGENTTGIIVNNYGRSGSDSTYVTDFTNAYGNGRWSGGPDQPADLVIYAAGANDAANGVAPDVWANNLRTYLSGVRDGSTIGGVGATGNTDILILMQHIGKFDNATTPRWHEYISRVRPIAEAYNAALVNMWPIGRNSWNYWNSIGHWGTLAAGGGGAGTDPVHMSDAGHNTTANVILPILTS